MTYRPKRNPQTDIYQNNPDRFSSNVKKESPEGETEKFLSKPKLSLWESLFVKNNKRKLGAVLKSNKEFKGNNTKYEERMKEGKKNYTLHNYFLEQNKLYISEIDNFDEVDFSYFKPYLETIQETLDKIGIEIPMEVMNVIGYIYQKEIQNSGDGISGAANGYCRSIALCKDPETDVIFHELIHHIGEIYYTALKTRRKFGNYIYDYTINNGYWNKNTLSFVNEGITEIITYKVYQQYINKIRGDISVVGFDIIKHSIHKYSKGLYNTKFNYNGGYAYQVIIMTKMIELAAKKLGKSNEYIYNYLVKGYFIKGYKGLSIFYKAFGKDVVNFLLTLDIKKGNFLDIGSYHKELGFEKEDDEFYDYFDYRKTPLSQEIGDIIGINR